MAQEIYKNITVQLKFFQNKNPHFLWEFMQNLKQFNAFAKDMLYYQGDHPEELFFILTGKVKLLFDITEGMATNRKYNIPFNMYTSGSYFGDIELLAAKKDQVGRDGTAEVDSMSQILFITKVNLMKTLRKYDNIKREMRYIAGERQIRHEENISIIRKKFAETKREIIRDLNEENHK